MRSFAEHRVSPDPQVLLAHQAVLEILERGCVCLIFYMCVAQIFLIALRIQKLTTCSSSPVCVCVCVCVIFHAKGLPGRSGLAGADGLPGSPGTVLMLPVSRLHVLAQKENEKIKVEIKDKSRERRAVPCLRRHVKHFSPCGLTTACFA